MKVGGKEEGRKYRRTKEMIFYFIKYKTKTIICISDEKGLTFLLYKEFLQNNKKNRRTL